MSTKKQWHGEHLMDCLLKQLKILRASWWLRWLATWCYRQARRQPAFVATMIGVVAASLADLQLFKSHCQATELMKTMAVESGAMKPEDLESPEKETQKEPQQ